MRFSVRLHQKRQMSFPRRRAIPRFLIQSFCLLGDLCVLCGEKRMTGDEQTHPSFLASV